LFLRQIRLDTFAQDQGISSPTLRPGLTLLDYFDADVSGRDMTDFMDTLAFRVGRKLDSGPFVRASPTGY